MSGNESPKNRILFSSLTRLSDLQNLFILQERKLSPNSLSTFVQP
jgi:hypothetical protein